MNWLVLFGLIKVLLLDFVKTITYFFVAGLKFRRLWFRSFDEIQRDSKIIIPKSVNYHYTRKCNYTCGFCFHTERTSVYLPIPQAKKGLEMLKMSGKTIYTFQALAQHRLSEMNQRHVLYRIGLIVDKLNTKGNTHNYVAYHKSGHKYICNRSLFYISEIRILYCH